MLSNPPTHFPQAKGKCPRETRALRPWSTRWCPTMTLLQNRPKLHSLSKEDQGLKYIPSLCDKYQRLFSMQYRMEWDMCAKRQSAGRRGEETEMEETSWWSFPVLASCELDRFPASLENKWAVHKVCCDPDQECRSVEEKKLRLGDIEEGSTNVDSFLENIVPTANPQAWQEERKNLYQD